MTIKPDVQVTGPVAQTIIDEALPGEFVRSVSKLHGGAIAAIYEIALTSNRAPVILKVYPQLLHWKMRKEANMLALVQDRLRVPTPRVLAVDDTKRHLKLNYLLVTKLEGTLLGSMEKTLGAEQYLTAYRQIGGVLRDIHGIPMPAFGSIGADGIMTPHVSNRAYLTTQFERKLEEYTRRGGDGSHARSIAAIASSYAHLLDHCMAAVLCHNDLHASNVLAEVAADGTVELSGVLDLENAQAADPLMDLAKAAYYLGPSERRALIQGYGDTGRPQVGLTLRYYHLYFALVLWCWMAEIGDTAALPGLTRDLQRATHVDSDL
ncbi:aminoglycoside phosphotransferase family protein [Bradyrhizobium sp. 138]|uniref:phosphotransferase family protein n=1 Tax=Bradyrhizobium sp. 138 TaxID=2782615 RepID=UPI001FF784B7|nr:aminoglycoside phosphotransferase family protein [Bradyrhizobium sp. 138]